MDIIARRLWIIKQVLATTDEALLKKIEHFILTDAIRKDTDELNEPSEIYFNDNDYATLPENIKQEIAKLTEKVML